MIYPRAFSHIGLSVTDINKAIAFYRDVFGFYVIAGPTTFQESSDETISHILTDALGRGWKQATIAHLATSDKVGIELFQFEGAEQREGNPDYRKTGVFHFCIQDPDIDTLAMNIESHGGKRLMPVRSFFPDVKPFKMVYCADPFGNIIEIYSHSYELSYSPAAYDRQRTSD